MEEWRDERQRQEFAARARGAVVAEVRANLEELQTTGPGLDSALIVLSEVLREDDVSILHGTVGLVLPDFSSAAWRAAQLSQAAPYLDYEWVIQVSRAYEVYDIYSDVGGQIIDAMSSIIGRAPTIEGINSIYGRLVILIGVHQQVEEKLEALLEEEGQAP